MTSTTTVSFEDAVDFLGTFESKKHFCPFCKSSRWMLSADFEREGSDENENKAISLFVPYGTSGDNPSILTQGGITLLAMECRECGYMNLFSRERIAERLKKFREQAGVPQEGGAQ